MWCWQQRRGPRRNQNEMGNCWSRRSRLDSLNNVEAEYRCQPASAYAETARWLGSGKYKFEAHPFVSRAGDAMDDHAVVKLRGNTIAINPLNVGISDIVARRQRMSAGIPSDDDANVCGDAAARIRGFAETQRILSEVLVDLSTWTVHVSAVHVAASGGGDEAYAAAYTIPAKDVVPVGTKVAARPNKGRPAYVTIDRPHPAAIKMTEAIRKELNHQDGSRQGLHRVDSAKLSKIAVVSHSKKGGVTVESAVPPAYQFSAPTAPLEGGQHEAELAARLGKGLIAYSPQFCRYVVGGADGVFPDPNTNFRYAAACLLQAPIIDRTGTIVDPEVSVTILDPLPLDSGASDSFFKGFSVSCTAGLPDADRLGNAQRMLLESGFAKLMAATATEIFEKAVTLAAAQSSDEPFEICVLWSGGIDSTAALLALMAISPLQYTQNRECNKRCSSASRSCSDSRCWLSRAGIRLIAMYAERSVAEFEALFDSHINGDAFSSDGQVFAAATGDPA